MSTTLSSTLTNLEPIFRARAQRRSSEKQVMRNFVDVLKQQSGTGRSYNEPTIGRLTAYAGSEGVPVGQAQALADANNAYTPTEHVIQVVISKRAIFTNREPVMSHALEQMTDALATRKDTQITALFSSAGGTNSDLGAAGSALATQDVFAAHANVVAADDSEFGKIPRGEGGVIIFAHHPLSLYDIEADIIGFSSSTLAATSPLEAYAAEVFKGGLVESGAGALRGKMAGALVVQSTNITPDASDDAVGIVYARNAFALVESADGLAKNTDMTQISGRAAEITMAEWYVAAERTDAWAQPITADAAAAA